MSWPESTIWWHVYPLGFTGAPVRPEGDETALTHRLPHLTSWLDYAVELGVNGLLLGPVFASSTHGYDTVDYFRIDPRLGDDDDIDELIAEAKRRGIRVVFDGVFNHVGTDYPAFQRARSAEPDSPDSHLFHIDFSDPDRPYRTFEGHDLLAAFNHDAAAVVDLVALVMDHWLQRGIDGWRLDAAYAVPAEFWAKVLPRVRQAHPEAWFVGEMIHGDYDDYATTSTLDSVTEYELWKATWSALKDDNFYELDWTLQRHNALLTSFLPQTFVGNHDVTRIASQVGQDKAALAAVILMTVGGIPSIYYGDEQGFAGVKEERIGGDDDVRPAFPPTPDDLDDSGQAMYQLHRDLIGLRRRHPWLVRAHTETLELSNMVLRYRSSDPDGDESVTVHLKLDGEASAQIETSTGESQTISV